MRPGAILTVEQRFLRGPNLWSGQACLVSLVDMGPLAHAVSTDVPGLGEQLLSLLPGLHDFADALAHGAYLAEVLARVALELQRIAGAPPGASCATLVHGRRALARIIFAGQLEALAVQSFALARDIVLALCAGKTIALRARMAALGRTVRQCHAQRCQRAPHGNCLAPGGLHEGVGSNVPLVKQHEYLRHCALGRLGTVEEVAEAAAFFVPDKNSCMSGATVVIDGAA